MSVSDELQQLAELHRSGDLSDEEYGAAKARLLHNEPPDPSPTSFPSGFVSGEHQGPYAPAGLVTLGKWTSGLVWVGMGLGVVSLFMLFAAISANSTYEAAGTEASALASDAADQSYLDWSGLSRVWLLLAGVVFVVWLYRVYKQSTDVTEYAFKWSPGWAIGGWFVPFLNAYVPYRMTADVACSVRGGARSDVLVWWLLLIVTGGLAQVSEAILQSAEPSFTAFYAVSFFEELSFVGAGIAGALMVRRVSREVVEASQRPAVTPTGASSPEALFGSPSSAIDYYG